MTASDMMAAARAAATVDVSVVVPTRNEAANVESLVRRASAALGLLDLRWELIFVDDSDDLTPVRVAEAERAGHPVRLIHRLPDARSGGLSGAVLVGLQHTQSQVVVVMDGDLQHPPEMLASLIEAVRDGSADVAVASRFAPYGGGIQGLDGRWRRFLSHGSRSSVRLVLPHLRSVTDPLSGYFAFRRRVIEGVELRPEGFKILLEVLVRGSWDRVVEIPCALRPRQHGRSKAGLDQGVAFGRHLARLVASR
jgi:glycosyltransferase involved in cell wall biosynthesis